MLTRRGVLHSVGRQIVLWCFLLAPGLAQAEPVMAQDTQSATARAVQDLRGIVEPLIEDASKAGSEKRVCKGCLPALPSNWRAPDFYRLLPGGQDVGSDGVAFLRSLRAVIRNATCAGDSEALQTLSWLSGHVETAIFTEAEALLLDHRAVKAGLDLNFRQFVRTKLQQQEDTADAPGVVARVSQALREDGVDAGITQIPSVHEICKS